MSTDTLVRELKATKDYFDRSTRCLEEKHAGFTPAEGSMSAAQQIAHVAQTVDWFLEGAFGKGFDMDFEGHIASVMKVQTLADARAWLDRAFDAATEKIGSCSAEEIQQALAEGPIMGGQPRADIVGSIVDHTAHHRGALTVYARLQGLTPAMPYMETAPS